MERFVYTIIFDTKHHDYEIAQVEDYLKSSMYGAIISCRNRVEQLTPDYLIEVIVVAGSDEEAVAFATTLKDNYIRY